jgi:hypothetical protein
MREHNSFVHADFWVELYQNIPSLLQRLWYICEGEWEQQQQCNEHTGLVGTGLVDLINGHIGLVGTGLVVLISLVDSVSLIELIVFDSLIGLVGVIGCKGLNGFVGCICLASLIKLSS